MSDRLLFLLLNVSSRLLLYSIWYGEELYLSDLKNIFGTWDCSTLHGFIAFVSCYCLIRLENTLIRGVLSISFPEYLLKVKSFAMYRCSVESQCESEHANLIDKHARLICGKQVRFVFWTLDLSIWTSNKLPKQG